MTRSLRERSRAASAKKPTVKRISKRGTKFTLDNIKAPKDGMKTKMPRRGQAVGKVQAIRDFKRIGNQTLYLVERADQRQGTWETEQTIQALDILSAFQAKVQSDAGYSLSNPLDHAGSRSRACKARAVMRLKDTSYYDVDDDSSSASDDAVPSFGSRKRKTKSKKTTAKGPTVKKLRGIKAIKAEQAAQRAQRQQERAALAFNDNIAAMTDSSCCLRCATHEYRRALETEDVSALKRIFESRETIPHWNAEDNDVYGDSLLHAAFLTGELALVSPFLESDATQKVKRISVPERFTAYGSNTGYVSRHTFHHAVRRVNESRGNRQGNSAFFRYPTSVPLEVDIDRLKHALDLRAWVIIQDSRVKPHMLESFISAQGYNLYQKAFYFCVASGNQCLAAKIVSSSKYGTGFNHLHANVLQFTDGKKLEAYRRPQILKKAADAGSITPLECAAIHSSADYLKELYEQLTPSERTEMDEYGRTVAHFAAASATPACIEYLTGFDEVNLNLGDRFKLTPLIQAARFGRAANIRVILKSLTKDNLPSTEHADQTLLRQKFRALHYAAYFGHLDACRVLVECGATIDILDSQQSTPLQYAALRGHLDCVQYLLEQGADPESADRYSRTPLLLAARNGHTGVVRHLLQQGVDANAGDSSDNRPIHYAAAFGHLATVQMLLELGQADPAAANVWRTTACSAANLKGHLAIVTYLLENTSVDVNFKDQEGMTMLHHCVAEVASSPVEVDQILRKARLLISKHADINMVSIKGDTPLHVLARTNDFWKHRPVGYREDGYKPELEFDDRDGLAYQQQLAELLIRDNAIIDAKNLTGQTPLAVAMHAQNDFMVCTLLKHGADPAQAIDTKGRNFYHYLCMIAQRYNDQDYADEQEKIMNERRREAAYAVWETACALPVPETIASLINQPDHDGYPPFLLGTKSVVAHQREVVTTMKNRVRAKLSYRSAADEATTERPNAVFKFHFDAWFELMDRFIQLYKPDMRATVQLPKGFFKTNPKRPVSDYPKETGDTALHLAATTQHAGLIEYLLKQGCDPCQTIDLGDKKQRATAMQLAYFIKRDNVLDYLPSRSLNIIEYSKKIYNIIKPDFSQLLPDTLRVFMQYGANPCQRDDTSGDTVLIQAAKSGHTENLAILCSGSLTSVDTRDKNGSTALMHVIHHLHSNKDKRDLKGLEVLLNAGANVNLLDKSKQSPFIKALELCSADIMQLLLEKSQHVIDYSVKHQDKDTVLSMVCSHENLEIVTMVLADVKKHPVSDAKALACAAERGNLDAVQTLLICTDPNAIETDTPSALALAAKHGHVKVVELLLAHQADANYKDEQGNSVLHYAVESDNTHLVKLLLDHGADAKAVNGRQQTPLHLAIESTKAMTNASMKVERVLLASGADINATDILGRTPIHTIFVHLNLIPDMRKTVQAYKRVQQMKEERAAERKHLNTVNSFRERFARLGDAEHDSYLETLIIKYYEERKQEQEPKEPVPVDDENVANQLNIWIDLNWEKEKRLPAKYDPINLLLFLVQMAPHATLNLADVFGRTPLHYAACLGAFSCTSTLLEKNAPLNVPDHDENTPLQLALRYEHVDLAVMLSDRGANAHQGRLILPDTDAKEEPDTTFSYSLSKNYINMAYVIMRRKPSVLEAIHDALKNGKFQIAEALFEAAETKDLAGVTDKKQTIWHLIANFTPFNYKIWDEYLFELTDKYLNVLPVDSSALDAEGCSPMHYAAKHGQNTLLRHLCGRHTPNVTDNEGRTELWYAAAWGQAESAKILLEAGAQVNLSSKAHDSVLLAATKANNTVLVQHLLQAGAALDDDTPHDRGNAIMWCCQRGYSDTLSAIVAAGACVSTPSRISLKYEGIRTMVMLPPLLVADRNLFPLLVKSGADLNVYGPEVKPFKGASAFLYFSRQGDNDRLKLMLDYAVDVNRTEKTSGRSIFYTYLFDKKLKHDLPSIWERLLRVPSVQVSHPDPVTQMTPLEYFIREHDTVVVDRLLELGADPTVLSAATDRDSLYKPQGPVNAFFHAVAQNDLAILQKLCEHTGNVDWHMTDQDGATIVSFAVRSAQGYSYQNVEMLKYLQKAMGDSYLTVFEKADHQGLRPADYACRQRHDLLYQLLIELGAAPADADQDMEDAMEQDNDFIPTQELEDAAEAERAALERQEKEKAKPDDEPKDKDEQDKIDSYSGMQTYGRLVYDESHMDRPLDIMLQKIDINSYSSYNMFYKMSVIYNTVLDVYVLWTRWGAFGEEGMHQKTPYLTQPEAVAEFRSIFRSKTGNVWDDYLEGKFESKPSRFELIRARPQRKLPVLRPLDLADELAVAPSQLPRPIHETMQVIADFGLLMDTYKTLGLDVPVGQVPQSSIDQAYVIMKRIQANEIKFRGMQSNLDTAEKHAKRRELAHKLCQDSTAYYRLLPRANDKKHGISPLHNKNRIDEEMGRLNNVSYVNFSAQVVLAARHHAREINPLDYSYRALQCRFEYISKEMTDFTMVSEYLRTTAKHRTQWQVEHLFKIDRFEERERFAPYAETPNRMLLWHGSHVANFMGILKQGLRPKPATAGYNGSLYGNGIYFADMFGKSIGYAGQKEQHQGYALLALCEVALGNVCEQTYYNVSEFQEGDYHSIKGLGEEGPDAANSIYDDSGVKIPLGPSMRYDYSQSSVFRRPVVNMNEYVVYDEARVRIRYLVLVRDTSLCGLCQKTCQNLRPLSEVKIRHDNVDPPKSDFSVYDALNVRTYAISKNTDCKTIVNQHLDDWLETRKYLQRWQPLVAVTRETPVCGACQVLACAMITGDALQNDPDTPAAIRQRPVCHYGRECRNKHTISHAQRYQHWCLPRKPGNPSKVTQKEPSEMLDTFSDGPSSDAASESEIDEDEDDEDEDDEDEDDE